jgi:hypothetical protein
MFSLRPFLAKLLETLPPAPADQEELKELVSRTLTEARPHASTENWKSQWEYLLKDEIFRLVVRSPLRTVKLGKDLRRMDA